MKRVSLVLLIVILLGFVVSAVTGDNSSANYSLMPTTLPSGGQDMFSADYSLGSTVGQVFIGRSASPDYAICSGFWCQIAVSHRVFLALVLRDSE